MTRVYFWRYRLRSRTELNARTQRREHEGALIRVGEGYGCIHPWTELGDRPLGDELAALAEGDESAYSPLILGALECARVDGNARREGVSLFHSALPDSHWLARPGDDPWFAKSDRFEVVKIKGSPDWKSVRREMARWMRAGFRIRLDFNESLEKGECLKFWQELTDDEREAIDVIEDPETWTEWGWMDLRDRGVPLAVDRDHPSRLRLGDVMVMKPAYFGWACNRDTRFYVTSNMDHAIGQMYAAWWAAVAHGNGVNPHLLPCGLLTHRCFDHDDFFDRIRTDGPRLLPVEGTGLGFDDLLEKLPWKRLN